MPVRPSTQPRLWPHGAWPTYGNNNYAMVAGGGSAKIHSFQEGVLKEAKLGPPGPHIARQYAEVGHFTVHENASPAKTSFRSCWLVWSRCLPVSSSWLLPG
jgi:hypothetical protein